MDTKSEEKKPIYKKWWFWVIVVVVLLAIGGSSTDTNTTNNTALNTANDIATGEATPEEQKEVITIVGEELGEYGKLVTEKFNGEDSDTNYVYKLPSGTYRIYTEDKGFPNVFIVKDELKTEKEDNNIVEHLDYTSDEAVILTNDENNNLNGHAVTSAVITLGEDESVEIVGKATIHFEKQ